jgi:hypothetical protein
LKRTEIAVLFLLACLISTTNAVAQPDDEYGKGLIDWRLTGGGALPVDVSSARPDRRLSFGAVEIGRIMTTKHGPGILAGQFELSLQMMPMVVRGPEDFWGVGLTPVSVRWPFSGKVVRPFVDVSAGLMLVAWKTPGPGRIPGNFNEQIGFGVRVGHARSPGFLFGVPTAASRRRTKAGPMAVPKRRRPNGLTPNGANASGPERQFQRYGRQLGRSAMATR